MSLLETKIRERGVIKNPHKILSLSPFKLSPRTAPPLYLLLLKFKLYNVNTRPILRIYIYRIFLKRTLNPVIINQCYTLWWFFPSLYFKWSGISDCSFPFTSKPINFSVFPHELFTQASFSLQIWSITANTDSFSRQNRVSRTGLF